MVVFNYMDTQQSISSAYICSVAIAILLGMIPGLAGHQLSKMNVDEKELDRVEAIVLSMTTEERKKPELINGTRRARVAKGSGRPVSEVNRLLEQFREMQKMMKRMAVKQR